MKHISLLASLFLCIPHTSQAMEIMQKNISKPSVLNELCLQGIANNNHTTLKNALVAGADVNYINSDGKSLFYLASATNNEEIFKILITHENIDINSRTSNGATPLHGACELGLTETISSMLIKAPRAANVYNKAGNIPLHVAAFRGQKDCAEFLLSHDIMTINHQNYRGKTALHIACSKKQLNIIKLLIEKDAKPTIKSNQQTTPLINLFFAYDDLDLFYSLVADNPSVANKLIHTSDQNENNQFHLCATIQGIVEPKFTNYLLFLTSHNVDINARNKDDKRAVDIACEEYTRLYNFYKTNKSPNMYKDVTNQERVKHAFLCFTAPHTQYALFTHLLQQYSADDIPLLKELISSIARMYYELNIETIIANKYQYRGKYYDDCIENKNEIKKQLLENPKPKLLWKERIPKLIPR